MNSQVYKEQSHGTPLFPLHVYSNHDPEGNLSVPYHWHDEIEFIYIEHGELVINLNGDVYHAKAGELYFINSQDLHQITACSGPNTHHAIVFNPEMLKFELYDDCQINYINPLIQQQLRFLFHISPHQKILDTIIREYKEAITAYQQQEIGWSIIVKAALLKILAVLIKEDLVIQPTELITQNNSKVAVAKIIMTYIHDNYHEKITIQDLAQISNMSPQYFCKFFKSMFGKTAIEYINEYRIEQACHLLKETDDMVMNIAFAVGFENFSYFIRKFKSIKKTTPTSYRQAQSFNHAKKRLHLCDFIKS